MKKRLLGANGPMVSEIGLGCWSFAGAYGPTDEAESHETLKTALDLGIDFLDTANVYGMGVSEKTIGSFIKGDADKFTIATKAGMRAADSSGSVSFGPKKDRGKGGGGGKSKPPRRVLPGQRPERITAKGPSKKQKKPSRPWN